MDAKAFYEEYGKDEAERVALAAETTLDYFKQIMYGNRLPGHGLAKRLETESGGRMTRNDLRPDIFGTAEQTQRTSGKRRAA